MHTNRISSLLVGIVVTMSVSGHAWGQSQADLAKAAQNPIANMISLPLQNNTSFDYGPQEGTLNVLNIQPVWPIDVNKDWNIITRTILPVVSQPALTPNGDRENGFGNTTFSAFLSPKSTGHTTWGAGPVVMIPTSTDSRLGTGKWGLGISVVALTTPGKWVIGSLLSNLWSLSGEEITIEAPPIGSVSFDRKVNVFTWQYFVNYNLDKGWYLTTSPIITANWEASGGNKWTVPFGGGVGKIFKVGKQPMNASAQAFYNAEKPQFGADWSARLQLQWLFPK